MPLDLWDPFGFTKKMTPERKEKALVAEINNLHTQIDESEKREKELKKDFELLER